MEIAGIKISPEHEALLAELQAALAAPGLDSEDRSAISEEIGAIGEIYVARASED